MIDEFRYALRRLAKSVCIITSAHEEIRFAMTATAVSEVSLSPPAILICVNRTASIFPALASGAPFAVNILHQSQFGIADRCSGALKGESRFLEGDWRTGAFGVPLLSDAQASLGCGNVRMIEHGTHGIFIGEVIEVFMAGLVEPLLYVDGGYSTCSGTAAV